MLIYIDIDHIQVVCSVTAVQRHSGKRVILPLKQRNPWIVFTFRDNKSRVNVVSGFPHLSCYHEDWIPVRSEGQEVSASPSHRRLETAAEHVSMRAESVYTDRYVASL